MNQDRQLIDSLHQLPFTLTISNWSCCSFEVAIHTWSLGMKCWLYFLVYIYLPTNLMRHDETLRSLKPQCRALNLSRLHHRAVAASWIWRKDRRHACKWNTSWEGMGATAGGSDQVKTPATMVSVVLCYAVQDCLPETPGQYATDRHSSGADRIWIAFWPPGTALSREALDKDLWMLDGETGLPSGTGRAENQRKLSKHV